MASSAEQSKGWFTNSLGALIVLVEHDLGAAVGVVGSLWAGFTTIAAAQRSPDHAWPLYLVGGTVFVALAVVCRWRGRG
jgi:hypothetical protein